MESSHTRQLTYFQTPKKDKIVVSWRYTSCITLGNHVSKEPRWAAKGNPILGLIFLWNPWEPLERSSNLLGEFWKIFGSILVMFVFCLRPLSGMASSGFICSLAFYTSRVGTKLWISVISISLCRKFFNNSYTFGENWCLKNIRT